MRKKRKYLYGILVVITMLLCFPSSVFAQEKVDISREAFVKVYFEADGNGFADVEFCIYRIADVSEEGNFTLSGDFLDYPISLGNLDSSKWRALAQTLEAYIARDGIKAFQVKRTGKMGEAVFEQIPTGLYLVTGDSVRQGRNIYTPEPFLVSLPTVDQNNGQWLYDAEMFCKYENSNVQENTVTRKVLKLWENDEAGVQRPEKITIQLLKNEEVYDTVILNAENNWSYSWEGLESDARWHVTEYETPEGNAYIGTLEIPALGISLPVMSEWSYPKLRIAPCRYSGSVYQDNLVIAAHNYSRHFGKIGSLIDGDQILFTDVDGNHFLYEVAEIQILESTDVEKMLDEQWDLNLFTCTLGGKTRMTVRCEKLLYDG